MLTIRDYNKENLDRSSITIVDRYLSIIGDKEQEIDNIKNATLNLYSVVYWYINDARNKLKDLNDLIDEWEDKTGIDTTPIREEIKHTENMVEAVEEITDDNYDGGDDTEEEIEEKAETVEENTEDVVEVIKENPEVKEGVKEEVKTEVTPTPTVPTTPAPATPEEAKSPENTVSREDIAESIRGRADDGKEFVYDDEHKTALATGGSYTTHTEETLEGQRETALDNAANVIANGGTAQEAVDAYLESLNPPEDNRDPNAYTNTHTYSPTDETAQTINDDIQNIIDAANEANASSESGGGSGEDPGGGDEPGPDPGCDCGDDCDCSDSDCPDNPGCPADTGGVMENC